MRSRRIHLVLQNAQSSLLISDRGVYAQSFRHQSLGIAISITLIAAFSW